uniref:VWFC domain-containing protein n=1 Tax=Timema shepardi TaxID=629360 RepID=A0A7R9AYL0_TIMSH|nr:unnamed protein product [Timema shepardi]
MQNKSFVGVTIRFLDKSLPLSGTLGVMELTESRTNHQRNRGSAVSVISCHTNKRDAIEIWEDMKSLFPTLAKIAMIYLPIVATSVPSGRLFSEAGATITQERNNCHYAEAVYAEGEHILTEEPCLNCSCVRGSLVCYLKVCPHLPNPPPPGCILLHRNHQCCPQLVCRKPLCKNELPLGEAAINTSSRERFIAVKSQFDEHSFKMHLNLPEFQERRFSWARWVVKPQAPEGSEKLRRENARTRHYSGIALISQRQVRSVSGCSINGTVYAEGSALANSGMCDYCYCLRGQQTCVRPQCVMKVQGCTPIHNKLSCCPTKYHCSHVNVDGSTTVAPVPFLGCLVDGKKYKEGEMVQEAANTTCENCFCIRRKIRCVSLSCPKPERTNKYPVPSKNTTTMTKEQLINEARSHREMVVPLKQTTSVSKIDVQDTSTLMTIEISTQSETETTVVTTVTEQETSIVTSTEDTISSNTDDATTTIITESTTLEGEGTTTDATTYRGTRVNTTGAYAINETSAKTSETSLKPTETSPEMFEPTLANEIDVEAELNSSVVTTTIALRREDENVEDNETPVTMETETTFLTSLSATVIIPEDMLVTDVTLRKNVNIVEKNSSQAPPVKDQIFICRIIPFVAADAVLEGNKDKPTAYPMQDRGTDNPLYNRFSPPIKTEGGFRPHEPILDGPFYESKQDIPYNTPGLNIPDGHPQVDITSGTINPPSITSIPNNKDKNCYSEGREYSHGELLSEPAACLVCVCHRGEVFCQDTKCPPVNKGCRSVDDSHATCCGRIVCDVEEFPTVVLDRVDMTHSSQTSLLGGVVLPVTVADGVVTTLDPFRDVIRTKPAPDLPSLISDLKPYLVNRPTVTVVTEVIIPTTKAQTVATNPPESTTNTLKITSTQSSTSTQTTQKITSQPKLEAEEKIVNSPLKSAHNKTDESWNTEKHDDSSSLFDSVIQFLFSEDTTETTPTSTTSKLHHPIDRNSVVSDEDSQPNSKISNENPKISNEHIYITDNKYSNGNVSNKTIALSIYNHLTSSGKANISTPTNDYDSLNQISPSEGESSTNPSSDVTSSNDSPPGRPPNLMEDTPSPASTSGILKLAGCNIYGRMYRVGKIISELSTPCLECMCTEGLPESTIVKDIQDALLDMSYGRGGDVDSDTTPPLLLYMAGISSPWSYVGRPGSPLMLLVQAKTVIGGVTENTSDASWREESPSLVPY